MPFNSYINVYDTSGILQAVIVDFENLTIRRKINNFDECQITLRLDHSAIQYFVTDAIIEVMRSNPSVGLSNYREYIGFHRTPQFHMSSAGKWQFTSYGRGLEDLLHRRTIRYYAGTGFITIAGPAETVMKYFVENNAGPSATVANGRLTNGVTPGLTVSPDNGTGLVCTFSFPWRNLLESLIDITNHNEIDFEVLYTGPATFEFHTRAPRLGLDRTQTVVFSTDLLNVENPSYTISRTEEITSILMLGQGEGVLRTTYEDLTIERLDSPWNLIESNNDARNEATAAGLVHQAESLMTQLSAQESFSFVALQTDDLMYGRDYFLGDLVTVRFGLGANVSTTKKLVGITLTNNEKGESVSIEFGDLTVVQTSMADVVRNLSTRIKKIETREAL